MHCLGWHFALSLLYLVVKDQQYFVTSSFMFLEEKNLLEILLNPGLNLTIFRETGPGGIRRSGNCRTSNDSEGLGNWVNEVSGLFFHQLNDPIYVEPNSLSFLTPITKLRVIRRSAFCKIYTPLPESFLITPNERLCWQGVPKLWPRRSRKTSCKGLGKVFFNGNNEVPLWGQQQPDLMKCY